MHPRREFKQIYQVLVYLALRPIPRAAKRSLKIPFVLIFILRCLNWMRCVIISLNHFMAQLQLHWSLYTNKAVLILGTKTPEQRNVTIKRNCYVLETNTKEIFKIKQHATREITRVPGT